MVLPIAYTILPLIISVDTMKALFMVEATCKHVQSTIELSASKLKDCNALTKSVLSFQELEKQM